MLKKLLIPFFVISVAAVASNGCGSSSNGSGTAGAGGGTAGKGGAGGGTAGAGTAGAGTAGAGTAGAGTDAGTAGAGTAGAGTDAGTAGAGTDAGTAGAGTDAGTAGAGTDAGSDASTLPACTSGTNTSSPLSPTDFCANLLAKCGTVTSGGHAIPATYMTMAECITTYTANSTTQKTCESYHLCWGAEGVQNTAGADPTTHCQHAWGAAVCTP